eukprot:GHVH01016574.1.p1 GENE.GHVH01016574.1~~GHVH01016574.1.p1  ORF type:complete len:155 (-),score=26.95 GHVH01016574.1:738-1202(-)
MESCYKRCDTFSSIDVLESNSRRHHHRKKDKSLKLLEMSVNPPSTPSKVPENLKFSSNKSVEVADRTSCSPELTVKGRGEERTKKDIRLWHSVQDSIDSMEGILDLGGSDDVIIQPVRMPKRQKMEYNSSSSVSLDGKVNRAGKILTDSSSDDT